MAYVPPSGSVVAFQSDPTKLVATVSVVGVVPVTANNSSVITVHQGSVGTVIIGGSIAASITPPANQSVSGRVETTQTGTVITSIAGLLENTIQASTTGIPVFFKSNMSTSVLSVVSPATPLPVSVQGVVTALQGGAPWANTNVGSVVTVFQDSSIITINKSSSVIAVTTGSVVAITNNNSVIGVQQGSVAAVIIGGSIATTTTNSSVMLLNSTNVVGSVATLQGTNPWVVVTPGGSVQAVRTDNASVIAKLQDSSIIAIPVGSVITVNQSSSIIAVATGSVVTIANNNSVIAMRGAGLIPATQSILVGVTANTNGSVLTTTGYPTALIQITSGPGASITAQLNFEGSLDGTAFVPIQGYNLATNAIASAAGVESDWAFNVAGLQGMRTRVSNWTVGSITTRAVLSPMDARPFAQVIQGSVTNIQGTTPWQTTIGGSVIAVFQSSSLIAVNAGSVVTIPSGSVINVFQSSSLIGVVTGSVVAITNNSSVITIQQANSIVGTYAEDSASADSDKGVFVLGVRNDGLSSLTSATGDYGAMAIDAIGRTIIKPFVGEDGTIISYQGSVVSTSVTLIQASAIGKKSYITDIIAVNTGAAATLITFQDGSTSILGYTIAPAGGGSNIPGLAIPWKTNVSQDLAFKAGTGTSILYLTVKGYQAQ